MHVRRLLALGIALLALAPAGANEGTRAIAVAPKQVAAEQLPVFVPSPDPRRTRMGETYRNVARSTDR